MYSTSVQFVQRVNPPALFPHLEHESTGFCAWILELWSHFPGLSLSSALFILPPGWSWATVASDTAPAYFSGNIFSTSVSLYASLSYWGIWSSLNLPYPATHQLCILHPVDLKLLPTPLFFTCLIPMCPMSPFRGSFHYLWYQLWVSFPFVST